MLSEPVSGLAYYERFVVKNFSRASNGMRSVRS
jgi:hypothetical protein